MHVLLLTGPTPAPASPTETGLVNATWALVWVTAVSAFAVIAGLGFAWYQLVRDRRREADSRQHEAQNQADRRERDAAAKADEQAGQARLAYAIAETVNSNGPTHVRTWVRNNSDKIITVEELWLGPIDSGRSARIGRNVVVAPASSTEERLVPFEIGGEVSGEADDPLPTLVYLDAAGLRWERVGTVEPTRILDPAAYWKVREEARQQFWDAQDQAAADYLAASLSDDADPVVDADIEVSP
jgi:hypothetical protein